MGQFNISNEYFKKSQQAEATQQHIILKRENNLYKSIIPK